MGLSYDNPSQPQLVPYMDLGGGLNTRLDPHALARNELAISQNLWSSYDGAIAKRPGSAPLITSTGAVGDGLGAISLSSCRFNNVTYLIKCNTNREIWVAAIGSTSWTKLGTVGATAAYITTAQMFDPSTQKQTVFICDGVSIPTTWVGPPSTVLTAVSTAAGMLPFKYNSTTVHITPQFVRTLGNNSHLFYSGESSNTCAVYVSDPFYPQQFQNNASQVTTDPTATYYPALIGNNDGVEGGDITGIESLASAMIVFKQSAVYTMIQTTLLGEVPAWQVVQVSDSTGCAAPRSITRFPGFVVFLSIDGVYLTDAQSTQKISNDVPTYFDSSLTGQPAIIQKRTLSIGVRHGNRYELWFCSYSSTYPNMGVWFDFDKQSRFSSPLAGEIDGMNVGGAVSLRGNVDDGNVAWADAVLDRVGEFGIGYADFTAAITCVFAGKADLFDDVFGPDEIAARKQMQDAYLLVQVLDVNTVLSLDFYGTVIVDYAISLARVIIQSVQTILPGGAWGVGQWGVMTWGASAGSNFAVVKIPMQNNARGYLMQVAIKETSTVPWIAIGYGCYVNMGRTGY